MYQVSTLQALLLGYTKGVISVNELIQKGDIGLGTFSDVNGEMIVLDGKIYRADDKGNTKEAPCDEGVPFASVAFLGDAVEFSIENLDTMEAATTKLNNFVDGDFGLNSMYVVRMDGSFDRVCARSEKGYCSQHIELSKVLEKQQKDFVFENIEGTMVGLYFPDYMNGINLPGWHLHFISKDRKHGGHVFDFEAKRLECKRTKLNDICLHLPEDAAFDTYSLASVSEKEARKVEKNDK